MTGLYIPNQHQVSIRQEGMRVVVIEDGHTVFDMPWDAALELAKAIISQAKKAEEVAKAEQVIEDASILMRAGAPFGLSSNPDIIRAAKQEAAWGMPRRYMQNNFRGVLFAPTVRRVKKNS